MPTRSPTHVTGKAGQQTIWRNSPYSAACGPHPGRLRQSALRHRFADGIHAPPGRRSTGGGASVGWSSGPRPPSIGTVAGRSPFRSAAWPDAPEPAIPSDGRGRHADARRGVPGHRAGCPPSARERGRVSVGAAGRVARGAPAGGRSGADLARPHAAAAPRAARRHPRTEAATDAGWVRRTRAGRPSGSGGWRRVARRTGPAWPIRLLAGRLGRQPPDEPRRSASGSSGGTPRHESLSHSTPKE